LFSLRLELVRIGNSRGIRIPKPILRQCGFSNTVELRVENDCLVIAPGRLPRQGWEEAYRAAGSAANDELLLSTVPSNEFDREDWQW
jgi:antitoxin MazE